MLNPAMDPGEYGTRMTISEGNRSSNSQTGSNSTNNNKNHQKYTPSYSNTVSANTITPPNPMMYYYQPFNPYGGYPGYPQIPMMNQTSHSVPVALPMPMPMTMQVPMMYAAPPVNPQQNYQSIKVEKKSQEPQVKSEAVVTKSKVCENSVNTHAFNLDDPEELEKWKAERRKRFPSANKIVAEPDEKLVKDDEKERVDDEKEGKEEVKQISSVKKRFCKYFARGKCNKGDSCPFEHVEKAQLPPSTKRQKLHSNQPKMTVFENLLKIEEKESMLKFYECIKILSK